MGMYTEFHFNCALNQKSKDIMPVLEYMLSITDNVEKPSKLPDHPLFSGEIWWEGMLCCGSAYFDAPTKSYIDYSRVEYGTLPTLSIRCNLKNYHSEIQLFIDWISPYLDAHEGKFLGFYRYEDSETPELIHFKSIKPKEKANPNSNNKDDDFNVEQRIIINTFQLKLDQLDQKISKIALYLLKLGLKSEE